MKKNIIKSNLLIAITMLIAVFLVSGSNSVNAATMEETKEIDLTNAKGLYYFYPEGYLEKNANNELEKVKGTTKKREKLTGKEFEITITSDEEISYNRRKMREITYNGEKGFVNVNILQFEVIKPTLEVKTIDLTNAKGIYYFYPEEYLEKNPNNELEKVPNSIKKIEKLTGTKFEVSITSDEELPYNGRKMREVIYNGEKGYMNVNVLKFEIIQQPIEVKEIDLSNVKATYYFYPKEYLVKNANNELERVANPTKKVEKLTGTKFEVSITSDEELPYNGRKMREVIYNGQEGYINVNTLKYEVVEKAETHKIDFDKTLVEHKFYPDTYLKVKSENVLGHIKNSTDAPIKLEGSKEVKFYTDTEYTLTTSNGTYKLYKAEMDGKTGYINVKLNDSRLYV